MGGRGDRLGAWTLEILTEDENGVKKEAEEWGKGGALRLSRR